MLINLSDTSVSNNNRGVVMRKEVCINLSTEILQLVEEKRGELIPRSRMIEHLIKRGLESSGSVLPTHN